MTPDDVLAMLRQVKYDLSVTQTRVEEAMRAVAQLPSEPQPELVCPVCRQAWRSVERLAEHVYNNHGGPVPAHYLAAEARAVDAVTGGCAASDSVPFPSSEEVV